MLRLFVNLTIWGTGRSLIEKFLEMRLHYHLPVYKTYYDLLSQIFQFTKDFSREYKYTVGESLKEQRITLGNRPSADNASGFRRLVFTKPANDKGKQKQEQVNPALRLPAGRWHPF
jgi:hypothetical protein